MRLIVGQLPTKAGWRDAHIVLWDLAEEIFQTISYNKPIVCNSFS